MATYIPGVQSYMPNWQPFTPDYKFLSDVLETKTNRYNTNYKALNDLYSKVVYSDLSRKDTQEMRNQYAENLGKQLELISGMDLSVMQNVDAAKALFKPFFEEDIIVKDMVFTKQFQSQMELANLMKDSPDAEQREKYWNQGVKALQYQMEDFKTADQKKALGMGLPQYVSDADLVQKTMTFLKAQGFDVTQEYVSPDGMFIVKDRNGNLITQQALQLAQKALMDDPMVQQAYYTDAYVKSRDFASAALESGKFKTKEEAQAAWAKTTIDNVQFNIAQRLQKDQTKAEELKAININWEDYIKTEGIIPGSDEDKDKNEMTSSYDAVLLSIQNDEKLIADAGAGDDESPDLLLNKAYNLLMGYNIQDDLVAGTIAFSNINKSREIKVNDYYKQKLEFEQENRMKSIDVALKNAEFEHDVWKVGQQHKNNLELEEKKAELAKGALANPFNNLFGGLYADKNNPFTANVKVDENGNPINPADFDYVKDTHIKEAKIAKGLLSEQIDVSLDILEATIPSGTKRWNTGIWVEGKQITGTLYEIKNQLAGNAQAARLFYNKMYNRINDPDVIKKSAPGFASNMNLEDDMSYASIKRRVDKIQDKRVQFNSGVELGQKTLYENYQLALKSKLTGVEGVSDIQREVKNGAPEIFLTKNGKPVLLNQQQYINEYVARAKAGQIKGTNFTSSHTEYDFEAGMVVRTADGMDYPKKRVTKFDAAKAKEKALASYQRQKGVLNATLNDTLNQELANKGKGKIFNSYDPDQMMRGVAIKDMTPGDHLQNPYYTKVVDPKTMANDAEAFEMISNLIRQVRETPQGNISFIAGNIENMSASDFKKNDEKAKAMYELVMRGLQSSMNNGGKDGSPISISYAPTYGPNGEMNKNRAAYVINIDPEFVKKYTSSEDGNKSRFPGASIEELSNITISFPQSDDKNPRKKGNYNFSSILTSLETTPGNTVMHGIPNGGNIAIYKDGNGNIIMSTKAVEYDLSQSKLVSLPEQRLNLSANMPQNESITWIDEVVNKQKETLRRIAEQNVDARRNQKQSNKN